MLLLLSESPLLFRCFLLLPLLLQFPLRPRMLVDNMFWWMLMLLQMLLCSIRILKVHLNPSYPCLEFFHSLLLLPVFFVPPSLNLMLR